MFQMTTYCTLLTEGLHTVRIVANVLEVNRFIRLDGHYPIRTA